MIYTNKYGTQLRLLKKEDVSDLYNKSCFYVTAFYDYPDEYIVAYGFTDEHVAVEYSRLITKTFLLRTRVFRSVVESTCNEQNSECICYDSGYLYTDCLNHESMLSEKKPEDLDTCHMFSRYKSLDVDVISSLDDLFSL